MPAIIRTPNAIEHGTYAITVSFFDESGAAVAPNTGLAWTLMDLRGNVINARTSVVITPAETVTIVLHGDDLALPDPSNSTRVVLLVGTYNSTLGLDLDLRDQVVFAIDNLVDAVVHA